MVRINPSVLIGVALTLVGLRLLVWWLEPRVAFYPVRGIQETPAAFRLPFADVSIPTGDGETLHGWWLEDPQARAQEPSAAETNLAALRGISDDVNARRQGVEGGSVVADAVGDDSQRRPRHSRWRRRRRKVARRGTEGGAASASNV